MPHRLDPKAAAAVMRTAGLEPSVPYPGAQAPWPCNCMRCGAAVTPRYYNIKNGWGGCRKCKHAAQSVYQRNPEAEAVAAMRAAGLEPSEPYPGRQKPWSCRCTACGRQVSPRLDHILRGQGGCKWCARRAVDPSAAAEVMRAAGLETMVPYPGAGKPWPCRCVTCGTEVTPRYNSVRAGRAGCIYCSHRENSGSSQRLDADVAHAFMVQHGLQPVEPYKNNYTPWRCRCMKCGTAVTPRYQNIRSGSGGCRTCFPHGFDPTLPALVYLVAHRESGAAKVGISRAGGYRLNEHLNRGWLALFVEQVPGSQALRIEKAVLSQWRNDLGLLPFLGRQEMPQGGWTETVDLDAIDIPATIERMKALAVESQLAA